MVDTVDKRRSRGILSRLIRPSDHVETLVSIAILLLAVLVPAVMGSRYLQQTIGLALIYIIATSGLSLLRSQLGGISFGQGAVVGASAYSMAMAMTIWNLPVVPAALVGFLVGMLTGTLLSLPSLRVQGYYLGFVTLAGAIAFPEILYLFDEYTQANTGINALVPGINQPVFLGLSLMSVVLLGLAVGAVLLIALVKGSRFGRQMRVTGESVEAASTLGLRPGRLRLLGFGMASLTASVAGVLYVLLIQYVAPGSFLLAFSILLYFIVVIGGAGVIAGTIAGVAALYLLPNVVLADFVDYRLLIYGIIAFLVMAFMPEGIVDGIRRLLARVFRRKASEPSHRLVSLEPLLAFAPDASSNSPGAAKDGSVLLRVQGVSKRFGSVQALDDVSIEVRQGELHAIVGPNGSGKTTLLNVISGLIRVDGGSIEFEGRDITRVEPSARARLGLGRTFQTPRILGDLTVWENIDCGPAPRASDEEWIEKALLTVRDEWDQLPASRLPHGQRRFLEIIRALRLAPTLIVLDEPAAGLSHGERDEFGKLLRTLVERTGTTILMIEHDLELVWGTADSMSLLDGGRVIISGTPSELRGLPEVGQLFAGGEHVQGH